MGESRLAAAINRTRGNRDETFDGWACIKRRCARSRSRGRLSHVPVLAVGRFAAENTPAPPCGFEPNNFFSLA